MEFCFISDSYYKDFSDDNIMINKDREQGQEHNRPCLIAFEDSKNSEIKWVIPLSTKYDKYKAIYDSKIDKRGKCDTIHLAPVLGRNQAFLLQNMVPITEKYILNYYVDKNQNPIRISGKTEKEIQAKATRVVSKQKAGVKLIFPNVDKIYKELEKQILNQHLVEADRKAPKKSILETLKQASEKAEGKNLQKQKIFDIETPSSEKLEGVFNYEKKER